MMVMIGSKTSLWKKWISSAIGELASCMPISPGAGLPSPGGWIFACSAMAAKGTQRANGARPSRLRPATRKKRLSADKTDRSPESGRVMRISIFRSPGANRYGRNFPPPAGGLLILSNPTTKFDLDQYALGIKVALSSPKLARRRSALDRSGSFDTRVSRRLVQRIGPAAAENRRNHGVRSQRSGMGRQAFLCDFA